MRLERFRACASALTEVELGRIVVAAETPERWDGGTLGGKEGSRCVLGHAETPDVYDNRSPRYEALNRILAEFDSNTILYVDGAALAERVQRRRVGVHSVEPPALGLVARRWLASAYRAAALEVLYARALEEDARRLEALLQEALGEPRKEEGLAPVACR